MPEYIVRMRNAVGEGRVFHIKAENEDDARRIASEHARKTGLTRKAIVSSHLEKKDA